MKKKEKEPHYGYFYCIIMRGVYRPGIKSVGS